jgi:preprotein translocase subunit SecY
LNPPFFFIDIAHLYKRKYPQGQFVVSVGKGKEKADMQEFILSDFLKRVIITLSLVLLSRILVLIPAPGIDWEVLARVIRAPGRELDFSALYLFSTFALGITPYLSAYMLVEIFSLFIPPLKTWRGEGHSGRAKLKKVSLFATFLFAFAWGYAMAKGFEGLSQIQIVKTPGLSFRLILSLTLTAGTFFMIWIADLITRRGIGHGVSVLILAGYGISIFSSLSEIKIISYQHSPLSYFLLFFIMAAALVTLIVWIEKSHKKISVKFKDGFKASLPLKITSAGITPVEWTSLLTMAPLTIYGLVDKSASQKLILSLLPGTIWYFIAYSIGIIFLYYFFTPFFYHPKKTRTFLENRQASIAPPPGIKEETYMGKSLRVMIPIGVLYLGLVVFTPHLIFSRIFGFSPGYFGGIGLIVTVAILLDLIEEIRVRRKGNNLVKVAELHDVPKAGLLKSILLQKGLPCHLQGYYHRALFYFFGPYIEISVLVPMGQVSEAVSLIKKYMDSNILTINLKM